MAPRGAALSLRGLASEIRPEARPPRRPRGQQGHGQWAAGPSATFAPFACAAAFWGRARAGGRFPLLVGQAACCSEARGRPRRSCCVSALQARSGPNSEGWGPFGLRGAPTRVRGP
eukprot:8134077-Pyramimonas_sp.AAC.1